MVLGDDPKDVVQDDVLTHEVKVKDGANVQHVDMALGDEDLVEDSLVLDEDGEQGLYDVPRRSDLV